ncbi:MAG: glycosyltransferase family 39 protein [Parcubacteria group bacterium]|nr:glycosyltransferase family 39 protein [Parcubacteria group bacterium]MCR4342520.1 glycosyltransferase family 39 protein [Patescibacteria group bacterium]
MNYLYFTKKYWFPILVLLIIIVNALIFLPKYGAWGGPTDVEYNETAINMANGDGFSLGGERTMFREPAYPFFLALNYRLFGVNWTIIRIEQFLLLFLIIYLTYIISYEIFGVLTARIASLAIVVLPIFPIYATDIISEIFAAFLVVLFIYLFLKSLSFKKVRPFYVEKGLTFLLLSGLVFGILALTKSIFIFLPVLILPIYLLKDRKYGLKNIVLFFFAFLVIVSPWVYRNYINFGNMAIADRGGMLMYLHSIKSEFSVNKLKDYAVASLTGEYIVRLYNPDFNIVEGEGIYLMNQHRAELLNNGLNFSQADEVMSKEAEVLYLKHPVKNLLIGFLEVAKVNAPMAPKYSIMFAFPEDIGSSLFEKVMKTGIVLIIRLLWAIILLMAFWGAYKALREKNIKAIVMLFFIIYLNGVIFFLQGVPRFIFVIYPFYFIFFAFSISIILNKFFYGNKEL